MTRKALACWLGVACLVLGCRGTRKIDPETMGRMARRQRQAVENDLSALELRNPSKADQLTWANTQLKVRLSTSGSAGLTPDETAYVLEPVLKRYEKALKSVAKKADKEPDSQEAFLFMREFDQWQTLKGEGLDALRETYVRKRIEKIDDVFKKANKQRLPRTSVFQPPVW